ncbi:probable tRNA methyltransferase 9B [Conger conger]|uniref:probable tRNA methyltransferase 9B n=1 Tax=Conger conger TaxID=82655 RepID=UPI002A5A166C|nr:probable tRNA methyltransferase 9B [Conger conger]XP_061107127.1 probable tRNA methyltransferase 9B [Conger conger]XP_061107128.1 probable tRNA methyltransferase 9B [Conger conger]XP_061107129.1 probable tRNA methyltransferase 9B [Conger conger]XP_061107130.1 probable tRNA methyltransferase 9B [Conger conger]XP_061107131.1 probable tRNA methyltransferase 9B [Conger conger]
METEAAFLERQYVHSVYDKTAPYFSHLQGKAWPRVREFLLRQKPGSLVADVGCGAGKYLKVNQEVCMVGCDLCGPLVAKARKHGNEVLVCDNLQLPFRDRVFSAVISIGVIHHFSTPERRVCAIKEMARTLAPGGELMIYVWAQEQKRRRFPKQDVLVPWNKALCSRSSSESGDEVSGRTALPEERSRAVPLGGELGDRRTHSLGSYVAVGNCCFRIPAQRDRAPRACLGRSLQSWFFSKSLDESSMKRFIERARPRSGPLQWGQSTVLVQPARHCSVDLGLGGSLLRQSSLGDDDVFVEAVRQEEEEDQWQKEAGVLNGVNGSARGRVHGEYDTAENLQLSAAVRSTNALNRAKTRALPLHSTDSILETVSVDGREGDLADGKDLMRYYHVFRGGELTRLIEENVAELSVLCTSFDHGNWCVIAKKNA